LEKIMTNLESKANEAFYAWEEATKTTTLSDSSREMWVLGYTQAIRERMTNYERAVDIYEKHGQSGVIRAAIFGEIHADDWRICSPCDSETPHEEHTCLVCGTED
jgi:membrane peptidoglycan carboxypeptidase